MQPAMIGLPLATIEQANRPYQGLSESYLRAVQETGAVPLLVPLLEQDHLLQALYDQLDGLLLCGGGDLAPEQYGREDNGLSQGVDTARDRVELALTRQALDQGLPILGICRGIQVLNVAAGGTLVQDVAQETESTLCHRMPDDQPRHQQAHMVRLVPNSRLATVYGGSGSGAAPEIGVNSTHHQAIKRLGAGLVVAGCSPDGLIEAIESPDNDRFVVGVQWHPEEMLSVNESGHRRLFRQFVAAAERRSRILE